MCYTALDFEQELKVVFGEEVVFGGKESDTCDRAIDEPYSVIASNELELCVTILGGEHASTLTSVNNLAAVLRGQELR